MWNVENGHLRSSQAMAPPTIRLEASRSEAWKWLMKLFSLGIQTAVVDEQCPPVFESRFQGGRDNRTFTFQHFGLGFQSGSWPCLFNVTLHYYWLSVLLVTI